MRNRIYIICAAVIVLLICFFITYCPTNNSDILTKQISKNENIAIRLDSLSKQKIDSVKSIRVFIEENELKITADKAIVQKTKDNDSLLSFYKLNRPGKIPPNAIFTIDSNNYQISEEELKYLTIKLIDYNFLDSLKVPKLEHSIQLLQSAISDKDSIISLKNDNIKMLYNRIEELKPSFFDKYKFWLGIIVGAAGIIILNHL